LGNQSVVLLSLGRLERARDRIDEHEQISTDIGDRAGLAMCAVSRAALAFETGDPIAAEALLDDAEAMCAAAGNPEALALGAESLRGALRRRRDMDADENEETKREREEDQMRLKSKKAKVDMSYVDFTTGFAKAHAAGDSDRVWSLLQRHLVCPKCEEVVSPNLGTIESEKTMLVLCPECEAVWIMIK